MPSHKPLKPLMMTKSEVTKAEICSKNIPKGNIPNVTLSSKVKAGKTTDIDLTGSISKGDIKTHQDKDNDKTNGTAAETGQGNTKQTNSVATKSPTQQ